MSSREFEAGDLITNTKKSKKVLGDKVPSSSSRPKTKLNRAARVQRAAAEAALKKESSELPPTSPPLVKKKKRKIKIRKKAGRGQDKANIKDSFETKQANNTVEVLEQSFDNLVERIPNALEEEQEQISQYRMMFDNLCTMTRVLETSFKEKPTDRTMYAIIKAYGELREIIADMRALADFSHHSDMIRSDIVNPLAEGCAAGFVEYHKAVIGLLRSSITPNEYLLLEQKIKGFAQTVGQVIAENQRIYQTAADRMFTAGK
jgi:hypothetical protein